jgi:hypothetical protein
MPNGSTWTKLDTTPSSPRRSANAQRTGRSSARVAHRSVRLEMADLCPTRSAQVDPQRPFKVSQLNSRFGGPISQTGIRDWIVLGPAPVKQQTGGPKTHRPFLC